MITERPAIELAVWVTVHGCQSKAQAAIAIREQLENGFFFDVNEIQDPDDSSTVYRAPVESEEAA